MVYVEKKKVLWRLCPCRLPIELSHVCRCSLGRRPFQHYPQTAIVSLDFICPSHVTCPASLFLRHSSLVTRSLFFVTRPTSLVPRPLSFVPRPSSLVDPSSLVFRASSSVSRPSTLVPFPSSIPRPSSFVPRPSFSSLVTRPPTVARRFVAKILV